MVVQPNLFLYSKLMENKLKTLHVPHPHVGLAYNLKSCIRVTSRPSKRMNIEQLRIDILTSKEYVTNKKISDVMARPPGGLKRVRLLIQMV